MDEAITLKKKQRGAKEYSSNYDRSMNVAWWHVCNNKLFKKWRREITRGSLLLDLGCGTGRSSRPFVTDNQVCGIDISIHMLNEAKKLNSENLFLVAGDIEYLPMKDETFDVVISYGCLHHLPDPFKGLREAYRVLKFGGKLFLLEANRTKLRGIDDFYGTLFKFVICILHFRWRFKSIDKTILKTDKDKDENTHPGHPGKRYSHQYIKELEAMSVKFNISTILFSFIPRQAFWNNHFLAKSTIKLDQLLDRLPLLRGKGHVMILEIKKDKK